MFVNLLKKMLIVIFVSMPVYADIDLSHGLDWKYVADSNSGVTKIESFNTSYIFDLKSESKDGLFQVFWAKLPDNINISNSQLSFTIRFLSIWTVYDKRVGVFLTDSPYDSRQHTSRQIGEFVVEENRNAVVKSFVIDDVPKSLKYLQIRIYDDSTVLDPKHTYQIILGKLAIGNPQDRRDVFDYQNTSSKPLPQISTVQIKTADNLSMDVADGGKLVGLCLDGQSVLNSKSGHAGIFVRDVKANSQFAAAHGRLTKIGNGIAISSYVGQLDLKVDANIVSKGKYIEISGLVSDMSRSDRAITVYFGIPLATKNWELADGLDSEIDIDSKNVQQEYIQTLYPVSTISNQKQGGLTLAIRMDEPRVFRFGYNTAQNIYFVAMDFALTPVNNVHNVSLSQAPFRILLYRNSGRWAFRSALERYYQLFPQFFNHRVQRPGGWGIPEFIQGATEEKLKKGYAMGMRYSWGHRSEMLKWNNALGIYNLLYIEPEYLQISMGDYKTIDKATDAEVMNRLEWLANDDPCEMEKYKKLHAYKMYSWFCDSEAFPKWGGTAEQYTSDLAKAALKSLIYDCAGRPILSILGNRVWLGDGNIGAMARCNLDPDIEGGKGTFSLKSLNVRAEDIQIKNQCVIDGVGLDSFLPSEDNYRKEHFKYSDVPLSFRSELSLEPMIRATFSSIEWLRWMRSETCWKDKIFMANLGCNYQYCQDIFSMMYLDVLGIEDRAVPNPDFFRILGYHKSVTDLPCGAPASELEIKKRLLQCIFPGYGHKEELLLKYSPIFEKLALAGWEPVPYVIADSPDIRIERYGKGKKFYLVVHNKNDIKNRRFVLTLENELLCSLKYAAVNSLSGEAMKIESRKMELELAPLDTTVIEMQVLN